MRKGALTLELLLALCAYSVQAQNLDRTKGMLCHPIINGAQLAPDESVIVDQVCRPAKGPLTNQDIVLMVTSRFDDATIIKVIQAQSSNFDVSMGAVMTLKNSGVSQSVIQAMLSTAVPIKPSSKNSAISNPNASASNSGDLPDELGVYVRQKGKIIAMEPEIVNWRTGGVVKHMATLGLDKGHVNGTVNGPHSQFEASWPPLGIAPPEIVFYIRCPEGGSAAEYQLLHLWDKGDRREFRSITGGVLHASGGALDNVMSFSFDKVAPRTYKISLPSMAPGEYGFLAPGAAASSNLASQGKIYTFRIVE